MELNKPITEDNHRKADEKYRELIEDQRGMLTNIAQKLRDGVGLNALDSERAAIAIEAFARSMSTIRKRARARPDLVPDELVVYVAGDVVFEGKSKNKAMEYYAEFYNVDISTIKKALSRQQYKAVFQSMMESKERSTGSS